MTIPPIRCPDCGDTVMYWQAHCRCGELIGFPNYREAVAEETELDKREDAGRAAATQRGIASSLPRLEAIAEQSRPVISMSFSACDDLLRPGRYRNYHQRTESGERDPAEAVDHANRAMVGERLFPTYSEHIHYAALSPDGRGLLNYGPVAVRWDVTPTYLGKRASLLEENSYIFYNRHALGRLDAMIPIGHRATWQNRAKLVITKLAPRVTSATPVANLEQLMVAPSTARNTDDFIEVIIYADRGLDTRDVNLVTVERQPSTAEETHRLDIIKDTCSTHAISVV